MSLRIVIADDEPLARERLRRLLSHEHDVEIVAECEDGTSTVEAVREHAPDLLLLDIQMPGLDGFAVIESLDRDAMPGVIFVTSHDQHAIRAFEERALDYLLKPTNRVRLHEAVERARARPGVGRKFVDALAEGPRLKRITVRESDRMAFVPVEKIDWIEAAGNYVVLHADVKRHICRETMTALENQLGGQFLRASRSAIVNLGRVRELRMLTVGQAVAVLENGEQVTVTRSIREFENRVRFH